MKETLEGKLMTLLKEKQWIASLGETNATQNSNIVRKISKIHKVRLRHTSPVEKQQTLCLTSNAKAKASRPPSECL